MWSILFFFLIFIYFLILDLGLGFSMMLHMTVTNVTHTHDKMLHNHITQKKNIEDSRIMSYYILIVYNI